MASGATVTSSGAGGLFPVWQPLPENADLSPDTPAPASPEVAWTVEVGSHGQTSSILYAEGAVWVSYYENSGGPGNEFVVRLDPTTGEQVAKIEAVSPPWETGGGGLVAGFGSIWVTGGTRVSGEPQALVERIDPATNRVAATIPLGGQFGGDIAIAPDAVWVSYFGNESAAVVRIDPATNEVVATIPLESDYGRRIVAADDAVVVQELVWEGNEGPCGVLTSIDTANNTVMARTPVDENCGTAGLFTWHGEVWASRSGLQRVDPSTARLIGDPIASYGESHAPRSFLLVDESEIWFGAYPGGNGNGPDTLARLNPATGEIEYFAAVKVAAVAAALGPDTIWALGFDGAVTRIDLR
jgi:DNA-binding beta-propeller fold protein YncE